MIFIIVARISKNQFEIKWLQFYFVTNYLNQRTSKVFNFKHCLLKK